MTQLKVKDIRSAIKVNPYDELLYDYRLDTNSVKLPLVNVPLSVTDELIEFMRCVREGAGAYVDAEDSYNFYIDIMQNGRGKKHIVDIMAEPIFPDKFSITDEPVSYYISVTKSQEAKIFACLDEDFKASLGQTCDELLTEAKEDL